MVLLEKLMVYNGILMETIGIPVTVSIGLLLFLFFLQGFLYLKSAMWGLPFLWIFLKSLFEHLH